MADEDIPLRSSMPQKSVATHHDPDPEAEKSIEKMLVGTVKFSIPDTSQVNTPMQRQYNERDFQSHRNEELHVHHPLGVLPRRSSKVSLKHHSQSTPGPLDPSLSTPSGPAKSARKSVPTNLPLIGAITPSVQPVGSQEPIAASEPKDKLKTKSSVPKIVVTSVDKDESEEDKKSSKSEDGPEEERKTSKSEDGPEEKGTTSKSEDRPKAERKTSKRVVMFTIGDENDSPTEENPEQPHKEMPLHSIQETPQRPSQETPQQTPQEVHVDVATSHGHHHRHHHHKDKDKSHHKHHHHHHHHHHRGRHTEGDLLSRKIQGSHINLESLAHPQLPTEPEEAVTLNMADLEGIAEHRLGVVHRRHSFKPKTKTKGRVDSIIHVARSRHSSAASTAEAAQIAEGLAKMAEEERKQKDAEKKQKKSKKKSKVQTKKQYDHRPHEVFVEMDELFKEEGHEMQWKEKARWIKYEEDVEEGTDRWGKPHVASLTFHSLVELRKLLEQGSVLLDLEEWELSEIFHRVTDNLITSDQVLEEYRGEVLRALLIKHKHVNEKQGILRTMSNISLGGLARTPSDANFKHGFFKNLQSPTSPNGHEKLSRKTSVDPGIYRNLPQSNESNNANKEEVRITMSLVGDESSPNPANGHYRRNGVASLAPFTPLSPRAHSSGDLLSPTKHTFFSEIVLDSEKRRITEPSVLRHTPEPEIQPKSRQKLDGIMRKIPKDAEATTVLVGELTCLEKPVLCFVRLAEGTLLNGLTEVPIPVRFLFVLLGPGESKVDYHEIGRCFSTLMSNEHFNEVAYKADSMPDILSAMNAFIDDSMVLPAGNWDKDLLLPILRVQNQKMKKRWQREAGIQEEEERKALMAETDGAVSIYKKPKAKHIDPLLRTGTLFGGVINDIKRRYPHFVSDFTDALNTQCLAAIFFLFFAAMSPVITFGGVLSEGTENYMGVSEMLLGSALCGILFALFSGQPITIIGVTGPILVFEEILFMFCKTSGIEYLPFRFWVGIWLFLITIVTVAVEASVLVRYFTRFTEEVFAFLIAIIFMKEVFKKFHKIFVYHPLKEDYCYTKYPYASTEPMWDTNATQWEEATMYETVFETVTVFLAGASTTTVPTFNKTEDYPSQKCTSNPKPPKYQPNTALLSTILMLGTFLLAWFFKMIRSSKFLGKKGRQMIGDFGTSIAIMIMVGLDIVIQTVYTEKIYIPDGLTPTDKCKRGWIVSPLGTETTLHVAWIFAAAVPGFLAFILMFMETLIDGLIVDNPKNKLKKGSGFHLDLLLLGGLAALNGLLGLPWVWAATVRSVTHLHSLCVWSKSHAPGEKPRLLRVKEQRVTALVVNVLLGTSIALAPLLNQIPVAVLFGVFLYMGVSSLNGIQMVDRCFLIGMPPKHHPDAQYVRGVRTWRMHLYTLIQIVCVIILAVIKSTKAAISFPFFLMLLVPARQLLNRVFTKKELESLDSHEGEDDEDDEFHEAHMPV